ncbi:hypothetical protein Nepgr_014873 [Nepenthes gracilis]|uniref:Uncharacterized protein n=1 Tax=Nepenthes gracilis TaxID=150966 RepID=A0AAD3XPX0_NEPGR|nr:hypothetical protein Nepgr_014873 [Nepenthes gracilis]
MLYKPISNQRTILAVVLTVKALELFSFFIFLQLRKKVPIGGPSAGEKQPSSEYFTSELWFFAGLEQLRSLHVPAKSKLLSVHSGRLEPKKQLGSSYGSKPSDSAVSKVLPSKKPLPSLEKKALVAMENKVLLPRKRRHQLHPWVRKHLMWNRRGKFKNLLCKEVCLRKLFISKTAAADLLGFIALLRYNPGKCADEDVSDMEADFRTIIKAERRSVKIAREEDERELHLIEEEGRQERMKRKQRHGR